MRPVNFESECRRAAQTLSMKFEHSYDGYDSDREAGSCVEKSGITYFVGGKANRKYWRYQICAADPHGISAKLHVAVIAVVVLAVIALAAMVCGFPILLYCRRRRRERANRRNQFNGNSSRTSRSSPRERSWHCPRRPRASQRHVPSMPLEPIENMGEEEKIAEVLDPVLSKENRLLNLALSLQRRYHASRRGREAKEQQEKLKIESKEKPIVQQEDSESQLPTAPPLLEPMYPQMNRLSAALSNEDASTPLLGTSRVVVSKPHTYSNVNRPSRAGIVTEVIPQIHADPVPSAFIVEKVTVVPVQQQDTSALDGVRFHRL